MPPRVRIIFLKIKNKGTQYYILNESLIRVANLFYQHYPVNKIKFSLLRMFPAFNSG